MKTITRYQAEDGKIFNDIVSCADYEKVMVKVIVLMNALPLKGKINGDGYIQHEPGTRARLSKELLKLANKWYKCEDFDSADGIVGRYISDGGMKCLGDLLHIIGSTDTQERQWNQMYYARNPDKGVQKQIN